jgi:hypothetical protein
MIVLLLISNFSRSFLTLFLPYIANFATNANVFHKSIKLIFYSLKVKQILGTLEYLYFFTNSQRIILI